MRFFRKFSEGFMEGLKTLSPRLAVAICALVLCLALEAVVLLNYLEKFR